MKSGKCLKLRPKNIPKELTAKPRWVACKLKKDKDGKTKKIPYDVKTGKYAKINDPKTHSSFDAVVQAYEKNDNYDGIMFAAKKGDPYCFWDPDDCWGKLGVNAEIQPLLQKLNSYTEISPSGKGLRVVVKGKLPPHGRNGGTVEVYDGDHFISFTGHRIDNVPAKIKNRPKEVLEIHRQYFGNGKPDSKAKIISGPSILDDNEVIEKAYVAGNGDKFQRLYEGDTGEHASHSEADLALCDLLAFWCNRNREQMDRLFQKSGLYRKKWNEKHNSSGDTYGQMTINKAIADCTETYKADHYDQDDEAAQEREAIQAESIASEKKNFKKKPRGRTLQELKEEFEYDKDIQFVYRENLPKGMPVIIGGREGSGKTTNALQMGHEIIQTHDSGLVVWLATEGAVMDTVNKMDAMGVNDNRFVVAQRSDGSFKWEFSRCNDLKELDDLLSFLMAYTTLTAEVFAVVPTFLSRALAAAPFL